MTISKVWTDDVYRLQLGDEDGQGPGVELDFSREAEIRIESNENDSVVSLTIDEFTRIAEFIRLIRERPSR